MSDRAASSVPRILAPLRGVTIRAFRETFADAIRDAGFTAAVAPFIPANPGLRVTDRLLAELRPFPSDGAPAACIPQVITRHPESLRTLLSGLKDRGFTQADLNAGCPFPMIVRRGRGSGLFRTPEVFARLVETGCEVMGPGNFSVKTRLGLAHPDELTALLPTLNRFPLAFMTIHARTARQMYAGECDRVRVAEIAADCACPVILNGDLDVTAAPPPGFAGTMVGRAFVRNLGARPDAEELLRAYVARSRAELCGDRPVLGRIKELLAYWSEGDPRWRRRWPLVKMCRTVGELLSLV